MDDGFEFRSARDINQDSLPFPGKRPFNNPLDPTDANDDYDSDGLSSHEEFLAWAHAPANPRASILQAFYNDHVRAPAFSGPYDGRPTFGGHTLPLNYSDGDQTTLGVVNSTHPEYQVVPGPQPRRAS